MLLLYAPRKNKKKRLGEMLSLIAQQKKEKKKRLYDFALSSKNIKTNAVTLSSKKIEKRLEQMLTL